MLGLPNTITEISITVACILPVSKTYICVGRWDNYIVENKVLKAKGSISVDGKVMDIIVGRVVRTM